jgi:hypothetical protein
LLHLLLWMKLGKNQVSDSGLCSMGHWTLETCYSDCWWREKWESSNYSKNGNTHEQAAILLARISTLIVSFCFPIDEPSWKGEHAIQ